MTKFPWSTIYTKAHTRIEHETMSDGYDYASPRSVKKIPYDELADFEPDFRYVELVPRVDLSDMITSVPIKNGWMISSKFLNVLQCHKLPPHRAYPLPVRQQNLDISGYHFLHLPRLPVAHIKDLSIPEAESALREREDIINLDVIPLGGGARYNYEFVSRDLRDAIETAQLTGMRFGTAKLFRTA